jgi:hypothetical protein
VAIVEVEDEADARALAANDPTIKSDRNFKFEIYSMPIAVLRKAAAEISERSSDPPMKRQTGTLIKATQRQQSPVSELSFPFAGWFHRLGIEGPATETIGP